VLRSLAFYLVQAPLAILVTAALSVAACVVGLVVPAGVRSLSLFWSRLLLRLFRVEVRSEGLSNLPAGAGVYTANHSSMLDILVNPFRARRSLDRAAERIRGGESLLLFPEGTRSRDGSVGHFKRGSFSLAIEAGAPVVPVSLVGVKALVPNGLFSLRPGLVRLRVHAPIPVAGLSTDAAQALAQEARRVVAAGCEP
jgi:1-acyl-sn-glycerol-3-phosphate acyltransferase